MRRCAQNIIHLGGSMDPEAAFLLIRGMKTLDVRVERQCETAMTVAKFLEKHPKVARVHYPGPAVASRPSAGQAADARFRRHAGVRSEGWPRRPGGGAALLRPGARFLLAASLGGVESLVILPIYTSHYNMSLGELRAAGVSTGTVRVSVGLEDPEDLIEDLRQALA